jgi:LytR cell envelope-related transcriptional attenuator
VDAPVPAEALIRPWRTATLVASSLAAVELVLLLVALFLLLAKPIAHAVQHHAEDSAFPPAKPAAKKPTPAAHRKARTAPLPKPKLSIRSTRVLVLNGNGRTGAAGAEAGRISSAGYRVSGTGNAARTDYATTVVMYRAGYAGDAHRLATRLRIGVVGPLDGMRPAALHGAQLLVLLGAR